MFCERMPGGRRDRHRGEDALRVARCPFEHLHAAHRAADDAEELVDAEVVDEPHLRVHHVADGDDGKMQAVGLAGLRIDGGRPGGAHAAAEDVGADDEEAIGVDRLAGSDERLPPAGLLGHGMLARHVLVARQRVADEDGVGLGGVERAVGLVRDRDRRQAIGRRRAARARSRAGAKPCSRERWPRRGACCALARSRDRCSPLSEALASSARAPCRARLRSAKNKTRPDRRPLRPLIR